MSESAGRLGPGLKQAWPKQKRLRKRHEFLAVQHRGAKAQGQWLTGLVLRTTLGRVRVGFTVSTKVGGAVERNQIKRWLREAVRKSPGALPEAVDVVLIARPGAIEAGLDGLRRDIEKLGKALKARVAADKGKPFSPGRPPSARRGPHGSSPRTRQSNGPREGKPVPPD